MSTAMPIPWTWGLCPLGENASAKVSYYCLKVTFSLSSFKITPDLVRLPSKQDYPWKEKNRPEFLEKNQQSKDKIQTESLMVHSFINGNLTKALFSVLSSSPTALPPTSQELTAGRVMLQTLLQGRNGGETSFHKKVTTFDRRSHGAPVQVAISLRMIPSQQTLGPTEAKIYYYR